MAEDDVKQSAQSSGEENNDESRNSAAGSDMPAGEKSEEKNRTIPYSRFKEVNDKAQKAIEKAQKATEIVDWYRQNIGDPDEVIAFRQWKQGQLEQAKEAEAEGKMSPEKLAAIRKLMRDADPEYKALLEERRRTDQERMDAQFDEAEDQIRDLAEAAGIPKDDKVIARVAAHIMDEIKSDEKLMRMWQTGNMRCIKKAFDLYESEYLAPMRKSSRPNSDIADKRKISRLPSLPSGGSSVTSKPIERKPNDKGLTKEGHDQAWAVLQAHLTNT